MIRTLATRLALAESRYWLRYLHEAIEQSFLEAADEAGLPGVTSETILAALRAAHQQYPPPPPGWEHDPVAAFQISDHHTRQARQILDTYLLDRPILIAVCRGMHDRLLAFAEACDHDPTL